MCTSDSLEKDLLLGLTDSSTRNPDDELVQHLNCHAKQGTMEQPDLQGCGQ
jgi:hypothetical protein